MKPSRRGGARPGAGRPAVDPWRDIALGGELDAVLTWVATQQRLRAQRKSAWSRFLLAAMDAAEVQARRALGLPQGPLMPGSEGLHAILAARQAAWTDVVENRRGPSRRAYRARRRIYDKKLQAWLTARIARRHGATPAVARKALSRWRKLRRLK